MNPFATALIVIALTTAVLVTNRRWDWLSHLRDSTLNPLNSSAMAGRTRHSAMTKVVTTAVRVLSDTAMQGWDGSIFMPHHHLWIQMPEALASAVGHPGQGAALEKRIRDGVTAEVKRVHRQNRQAKLDDFRPDFTIAGVIVGDPIDVRISTQRGTNPFQTKAALAEPTGGIPLHRHSDIPITPPAPHHELAPVPPTKPGDGTVIDVELIVPGEATTSFPAPLNTPISVGRSPDSHIELPYLAELSGRHATLTFTTDQFGNATVEIQDHSSYGTFINGVAIGKAKTQTVALPTSVQLERRGLVTLSIHEPSHAVATVPL